MTTAAMTAPCAERDALRADLRLALYTMRTLRLRWHAAAREALERPVDRAFLVFALTSLLDAPEDAQAQADAQKALTRWEGRSGIGVAAVCTHCQGPHDIQRCSGVGTPLHTDPIPGLHDDLAKAQTAEEREQIVARIRLARAEEELAAARKAVQHGNA